MKSLRVVDQAGNKQDFDSDHVPRIGERIALQYGQGTGPTQDHYYRVKDVMYRLDNKGDNQAAILIEKESNAEPW